MVLIILRALFVLLMAAVGYYYIPSGVFGGASWLAMGAALCVGVLFICVDILSPRRKLAIFSGTFLGLTCGILIAFALSFVVKLLVEQFYGAPAYDQHASQEQNTRLVQDYSTHLNERIAFINLLVGVTSCYLSISFILQTRDDFRFIIPFVEFAKQTKGPRPLVVDTSVLIDGRIQDIAATGMVESRLIVPRFVLQELQVVADSHDRLKRNRGRRGLDVLAALQRGTRAEVIIYDSSVRDESKETAVDARLIDLAKDLSARVLTTDFNLNKVAQLRGVDVININDLANALKPVVLAGERMSVRIVKPGEGAGQGVGYLEDGTMVVVEQARPHVNEEVEFAVTSVLQTSAGKMIFGRMGGGNASDSSPSQGSGNPLRPPLRSRGKVIAESTPAATTTQG